MKDPWGEVRALLNNLNPHSWEDICDWLSIENKYKDELASYIRSSTRNVKFDLKTPSGWQSNMTYECALICNCFTIYHKIKNPEDFLKGLKQNDHDQIRIIIQAIASLEQLNLVRLKKIKALILDIGYSDAENNLSEFMGFVSRNEISKIKILSNSNWHLSNSNVGCGEINKVETSPYYFSENSFAYFLGSFNEINSLCLHHLDFDSMKGIDLKCGDLDLSGDIFWADNIDQLNETIKSWGLKSLKLTCHEDVDIETIRGISGDVRLDISVF